MMVPVIAYLLDVEPGADAHHVDPVIHRRVDVADDIAVLLNLAENPAHPSPPKIAPPISCG